MHDISELQGRLAAALDRIGAGLDALGPRQHSAPQVRAEIDVDALLGELEAERALVAQLNERIAANRAKAEAQIAELNEELDRRQEILERMEDDRAQFKALNDALRASNGALRLANEAGLGDDALINSGMQTEIEALRQMRASDRAELDAIIALLEPALAKDHEETQDA